MASSGRKRSLSGPCTSTPSKHKKYVCKYQQFWEKEFTWLKKSDTGEDMAHCKLCNTNFSVAAGTLYDVKWHANRSTHVTAVEASSKTKSITNFVDDKKSGSFELGDNNTLATTIHVLVYKNIYEYCISKYHKKNLIVLCIKNKYVLKLLKK
jgi:hypothetical protein